MNETQKILPHDAIDIRQLARAIRFALIAFLLVLSYLNLWSSFSIRHLLGVFGDMLGSQGMPAFPEFVLRAQSVFVLVSVLLPVVAVSMLSHRNIVRSFYIIGALGLVTIAQLIMVHYALAIPFINIIDAMANPPDMSAPPQR